MKKIFISYSRCDESAVRDLVGALHSHGHEVWLDKANLQLGQKWWDNILTGIRESDVVIFVVSQAWLDSGACKAERRYALTAKQHGTGDVLVVLPPGTSANLLPLDLVGLHACRTTDIQQVKLAVDAAQRGPLPEPLPTPPIPLSPRMVERAVRTPPGDLEVDEQSSVAGFLIDKLRSPVPKQRRWARRVASEFLARPDLAQSIRISCSTRSTSVGWSRSRWLVRCSAGSP